MSRAIHAQTPHLYGPVHPNPFTPRSMVPPPTPKLQSSGFGSGYANSEFGFQPSQNALGSSGTIQPTQNNIGPGNITNNFHINGTMPPPGLQANTGRNFSGSTCIESDEESEPSLSGADPEEPFSPITININVALNVSGKNNTITFFPADRAKDVLTNVLMALKDASASDGLPMIDEHGRPRPIVVDITAPITIDGEKNTIGRVAKEEKITDTKPKVQPKHLASVLATGKAWTHQFSPMPPTIAKDISLQEDTEMTEEAVDIDPLGIKTPIPVQSKRSSMGRSYTLPVGTPKPMGSPHRRNYHSVGQSPFAQPVGTGTGQVHLGHDVPGFDTPGPNVPLPADPDMQGLSSFGLIRRKYPAIVVEEGDNTPSSPMQEKSSNSQPAGQESQYSPSPAKSTRELPPQPSSAATLVCQAPAFEEAYTFTGSSQISASTSASASASTPACTKTNAQNFNFRANGPYTIQDDDLPANTGQPAARGERKRDRVVSGIANATKRVKLVLESQKQKRAEEIKVESGKEDDEDAGLVCE